VSVRQVLVTKGRRLGLFGTGVAWWIPARYRLRSIGHRIRVFSLPCWLSFSTCRASRNRRGGAGAGPGFASSIRRFSSRAASCLNKLGSDRHRSAGTRDAARAAWALL